MGGKLSFSRSTWEWGGVLSPIWRNGVGGQEGNEGSTSPWCVPNPDLCLVLPLKVEIQKPPEWPNAEVPGTPWFSGTKAGVKHTACHERQGKGASH